MAIVRRCKNDKSNYIKIKLLNGKVVASHDEHILLCRRNVDEKDQTIPTKFKE